MERLREMFGGFDPDRVVRAIEGVKFPCSNRDIIEYARSHNAPTEVESILEQLPEQQYNSLSDVRQAVLQIKG